jgi:hypothetical protein
MAVDGWLRRRIAELLERLWDGVRRVRGGGLGPGDDETGGGPTGQRSGSGRGWSGPGFGPWAGRGSGGCT